MKREQALSEVIGFLMIVALLTILFSMYLLYVVPIQGRDAEISHMKYITQEFIGLKADIDGLIINNKINLPIGRSFELGTLSSVGLGALSIMPLSSYIEATGTLMVNEQNDFLTVTVNGSMVNLSDLPPIVPPPISDPVLEINCSAPNDCYYSNNKPLQWEISDRYYSVTTKERYSLNNSLVNPATSNYSNTYVYTIPEYTYANGSPVTIPLLSEIHLNKTYDLVLDIFKGSTDPHLLISEKTLIENISFPGNYTYNILKGNDIIPNNSSDYFYINPNEAISPNLYTPHTVNTKVGMFPPRIGSFQFDSANRYWVNQNLIYEMGGLFLIQPTGGSSVMLIPSIALTPIRNFTQDADPEYQLKVSINNIRITDTEDISGSVSAQIFTKVDQINQNLFNSTETINSDLGDIPSGVNFWKMREEEEPNARAIWLQFAPDDPRIINSTERESKPLSEANPDRMLDSTKLWKRGFDQIKTITNKTLSDNSLIYPLMGRYADWIYVFRIEEADDQPLPDYPPYTANMVIGQYAASALNTKCDPVTLKSDASDCINAVRSYMSDPCKGHSDEECEEFILDYTESELSLVMQSGAL